MMVVSSNHIALHSQIHITTWVSQDGVIENQIDHVLCYIRHTTSILDIRGINNDADHHLVRAGVHC